MQRIVAAALFAALLWGTAFATAANAEEPLTRADVQQMLDDWAEENEPDGKDFRVYWKNGLNMKSADGNFSMKIFGRIQADFHWFSNASTALQGAVGGTWDSGFEFRRARLGVSGTIYKHIVFKAQYDFADTANEEEPQFKDVYIGTANLSDCYGCGVPDLRVGHFKIPFSLEELSSSKYITFIERSLPVTTFAPSRETGFAVGDSGYGDRIQYSVGFFGNGGNDGSPSFRWRDGMDIAGRVTYMPWAPCDCESKYWVVGASYMYTWDETTARFRTRPEDHIGPRIVDTGPFAASSWHRYGLETLFVHNRWWVQAEAIGCSVNTPAGDNPNFWGAYLQFGYFLNGPYKPFKREFATIDKVKPCNNWLGKDCCGAGSWEIAARFSFVDLKDGAVNGGEVWETTLGVNWWLNPNTTVRFNYMHASVDEPFGAVGVNGETLDIFAIRFQVYW